MKIKDAFRIKPRGYNLLDIRRTEHAVRLNVPADKWEVIGTMRSRDGSMHVIQATVLYDPKELK